MVISFMLLLPLVMEAQVDNLSQMSAKWVRMQTRNAATDGADIVNYNPAGLVHLKEGVHISFSNQTLIRRPEHQFNLNGREYSFRQEGTNVLLPMLYAACRIKEWAIYSGLYVSGKDGTVNYPNGSINSMRTGIQLLPSINEMYAVDYTTLEHSSLKTSSYYITIPFGVAYRLNEKVSFSAGGRYLMVTERTKMGFTFGNSISGIENLHQSGEYTESDTGFGGIVGIHLQFSDRIRLAIHYESKVRLNFETTLNHSDLQLREEKAKRHRDLPATFNSGFALKINDRLSTQIDFNYYYQSNANWGQTVDPATGQQVEAGKLAGDCYLINAGFRYQLTNQIELSAGGGLTNYEQDDNPLFYSLPGSFERIKRDNVHFGFGGSYMLLKNLQIDLGVSKTVYKDQEIPVLSLDKTPANTSAHATIMAVGMYLNF